MAIAREQVGIEIVARDLAEAAFESVQRHIGGLEGLVQSAGNTIQGWSDKFMAAGRSARATGMDLSKYVTAPILAVGGAAIKMGSDYSGAISNIRVGTLATGPLLASLEGSFQSVAARVPQDMGTVSQAVADVNTRLDLTGPQLEDASTRFLHFARVHKVDVSEAIRDVTRLMNGMGVEADQLPSILDKLTVAAGMSGASVLDLATWVNEAGPSFEGFGFDMDRAIGLFAKFEREGAKPQEILSSLNIAFTRLAAEGFTDTQGAWDELIRRIQEAPNEFEATNIAVEAFGTRVGNKLAEDIQTGKFHVDDWAEAIGAAGGEMDRLAVETISLGDTIATGFNSMMVRVGATMGDEMPKIKNVVAGAFETIGDAIEGVLQWWSNLDDSTKEWIVTIALLVAAIGPVLIIFGAIASSIGSILGLVAMAVKAFGLFITVIQTTVTLMSVLVGRIIAVIPALAAKAAAWFGVAAAVIAANLPLILIVGIIALVVGAIIWLLSELGLLEPILDAVREAFRIFGEAVGMIPELIREAFFGLLDFIGGLVGGIIGGLGELIGFFEFLPGPLGESAAEMREHLKGIEDDFSNWGTTLREEADRAAEAQEAFSARQAAAMEDVRRDLDETGRSSGDFGLRHGQAMEETAETSGGFVNEMLTNFGLLPPEYADLSDAALDMSDTTAGALGDLGTSTQEAEQVVKASLDQITGAMGGLGTSSNDAWQAFKDAAKDGTEDPQERIEQLTRRLDKLNEEDLTTLGPSALAAWADAKHATEQELGGLTYFVDNQSEIISRLLPDALNDARVNSATEWQGIFDVSQRTASSLPGAIAPGIDDSVYLVGQAPPRMAAELTSGIPAIQRAAEGGASAAEAAWAPLPGIGADLGQEGGGAFAGGIDAQHGQTASAGAHLRDAAQSEFTILRTMSVLAGMEGAEAYASGIKVRHWMVADAGRVVRDAAEAVWRVTDWANTSGLRTVQAYAAGIQRGQSAAVSAARQVANAVQRILKASSPPGPESPLHEIDRWGRNTMVAWAEGTLRALPEVMPKVRDVLGQIKLEVEHLRLPEQAADQAHEMVSLAPTRGNVITVNLTQHFGRDSVRSDEDIREIGIKTAQEARLRGLEVVNI